ncbi:MAG TPA: helix-turn-helix domain-containing protein, partial [Acidimicrobiia bacterium]
MVGRPRSAECDRAILEAALAEYAVRGLEAMSVDAVAARAGVSKATIYRRYPSKVELVMA